MQRVHLDLEIFRKGAEAIGRMNGHVAPEDMADVETCIRVLDSLTKTSERFADLDAATRCLIRGGVQRIHPKTSENIKVYHVLRDIVGTAKQIEKDDRKRKIARKLFAGIANID